MFFRVFGSFVLVRFFFIFWFLAISVVCVFGRVGGGLVVFKFGVLGEFFWGVYG